jgi:DNA mismatch endonuclease, patch repair protein
MPDIVDALTRSRMMAAIGPKDTAPEMRVRRYLHALGLRFRIHDRRLPGKPDIVLPSLRAIIFVHGCFWHRHQGCRYATSPSSNIDFWERKFRRNVERDAAKTAALRAEGWRVHVVWECETQDELALENLFWRIAAGAEGSE